MFDQARGLFERFHLFKPGLIRLGRLRGVIYASDRGQRGCPRNFVHFFDRPPTLACDGRGEQMFIIGGRYRITRRGIEG